MTEYAVIAEDITKIYGKTRVVDQVSLKAPYKSSIVICGPSGSGKTTFLRLLAGLEMPDAGRIYLHGKQASMPGSILQPHKRDVGFVFQSPCLWPHMTVKQNILFGLQGLSKGEVRDRLNELLGKMELKDLESRYPAQISGGQARRVALARTLAPGPSLLLMDEPLTNLDSEIKMKLLRYVKDTVEETGAALIYVTHDEYEAGQISDQVLVMRGGCMMQ